MRSLKDKHIFLLALSVFAVFSISFALFGGDLPESTRTGLLVLAGISIFGCLVVYLYTPSSNPRIDASVDGQKKTGNLSIGPTMLGLPERQETSVSAVIREQKDDSMKDPKVAELNNNFYQMIENTQPPDYYSAANLLAEDIKTTKVSWKLSSNYARCLVLSGQLSDAKIAIEALLNNFGSNPVAVGAAHELYILLLNEETPEEEGKLRLELLQQQLQHVEKGLKSDEKRISLYLNGFEICLDLQDVETAISYLLRAITVDSNAIKISIERSLENNPEFVELLLADNGAMNIITSLGIQLPAINKNQESIHE